MKRLSILIISLIMVFVTGCAGSSAAGQPGTESKAPEVSEPAAPENTQPEAEEIKEEEAGTEESEAESGTEDTSDGGPVEISITRDDRSFPMPQFGDDAVFKYYYEMALLPDSVKNHEKINSDIEAKKDKFFAENGGYEFEGENDFIDWSPVRDTFCYASVKSIYLDDNYYSVNVERYSWFGGTDNAIFIGYTYDLNTGEEVEPGKVLQKEGTDLASLLQTNVRPYLEDETVIEYYPDADKFMDDEYFGKFNYCIAADGRVYILYDKYQILAGYAGCQAYLVGKYNDDVSVSYSEMKKIDGGNWYSLSPSQLKETAKSLNIDIKDNARMDGQIPYIRDNEWYVPVIYSRRNESILDDEVFASAEVKMSDPSDVRDTSDAMYEDMYGSWYSVSGVSDEKPGSIPKTRYVLGQDSIDVYDYDTSEECYKESGKKKVHSMIRTPWSYIIETENEDGSEKETFMTSDWDLYLLDRFGAWITETPFDEYYSTYVKDGSMISPKSADFGYMFNERVISRLTDE